jgi:ABC-type multidrug transport system ATPase subunit
LLGGSGSGKSTFLEHVLGLAKPDTGSITIDGVDITSWARFADESVSLFRRRTL